MFCHWNTLRNLTCTRRGFSCEWAVFQLRSTRFAISVRKPPGSPQTCTRSATSVNSSHSTLFGGDGGFSNVLARIVAHNLGSHDMWHWRVLQTARINNVEGVLRENERKPYRFFLWMVNCMLDCRMKKVIKNNCSGDYRDARALISRELRQISL